MSNENIGVSNENIGVSNENIGVKCHMCQVCLQTTTSFKKYDLRRDYKTVVD